MALITPSVLISQIKGKVGGVVFGNTMTGPICRMLVTPANPRTDRQLASRGSLSAAGAAWLALTSGVRDSWASYAASTPVPGRMGSTILLSGFNMFVRDYTLRAFAGLTALTAAPSTPGLAEAPGLTSITFTNALSTISVAYSAPWWKGSTGACLFLRVHRPQRVTRNTAQTPPRIVKVVAGNTGSPPASPQTPTCPWGTIGAAGSAEYYTDAVCIDATGRLSAVHSYINAIA